MNSDRLDFLQKLKKESKVHNVPNVTENNARFLHMLVKMNKSKRVLELGTANGYSAIWLADAVEERGGEVVTIDKSEPSQAWARRNFEEVGLSKVVTPMLGAIEDIVPKLEGKFDFVFIDAQKTQYPSYWRMIKPLLATNAVVVADDMIKFKVKLRKFYKLMDQETEFEKVVIPIDEDDGVMVIRKK